MSNFALIPGEAFTAFGSVANNLLDKLDKFCGWLVQPKGKQKEREEAYKYLIASIQSDPNKPDILKAAEIANARKILKEFENQNDIVNLALMEIQEINNGYDISEDWLSYFMDKARLVSDDSLKIVWAKVLASEAKTGNVSKKLLHILSIISAEDAKNFNEICSYYVGIEDIDNFTGCLQVFDFKCISLDVVLRLNSLGLIDAVVSEFESYSTNISFAEEDEKCLIFNYHGKRAKIFIQDGKLQLGKMLLTKEGEILQKIITSDEKENIFEYIFEQYPDVQKEIL